MKKYDCKEAMMSEDWMEMTQYKRNDTLTDNALISLETIVFIVLVYYFFKFHFITPAVLFISTISGDSSKCANHLLMLQLSHFYCIQLKHVYTN